MAENSYHSADALNAALVAAVTPIVPICDEGVYDGTALTFCTFNHSDVGRVYANGRPKRLVCLYQLHLCMPSGEDPEPTIGQLREAVFAAGFTFPSTVNADDSDGIHRVLEFQGRIGNGEL